MLWRYEGRAHRMMRPHPPMRRAPARGNYVIGYMQSAMQVYG